MHVIAAQLQDRMNAVSDQRQLVGPIRDVDKSEHLEICFVLQLKHYM